jgi:tetratricopeptide (TPR) repeat protein
MNYRFRRSYDFALRVFVAAACCLGIWSSFKLAAADYQLKKDTEVSIRKAIRWAPDDADGYMRLAQFDRDHARELLLQAVHVNRYNAQARIELGLQYEADGDFRSAETALLGAYDVDHTYLPRWTLANYYFRRANMPQFWEWARKAAEMPSDEMGPLFALCMRVSPDPDKISAAILSDKPELVRQYIDFLLANDKTPAVANVAPRLLRTGDPESDRPLLFSVVNRLVASADANSANTLWHLLIAHHWVVADLTLPNNPKFSRQPLPVSFDWDLPEYAGLHSWPGASGLEAEFTGSQPEDCIVAEQALVMTPGKYALTNAYSATNIPPATGLRWQIIDAKSGATLAQSSDLSSSDHQQSTMAFSIPEGASFITLRLAYRRAIGTPRIAGLLVVKSVNIRRSI